MKEADYRAAIDADAAALVTAARKGLDAPVPSCPGWTAGHVVVHVGRAYRWIGDIVATRTQTPLLPTPNKHGFDRADPGLFAWFEQALGAFQVALSDAAGDEQVWSWSSDQSAAFWLRLMALETAMHRYDAQLSHNCATPIDAALARSFIDFTLDHFVPTWRRFSVLPSHGETYHLTCTDSDGRWLVSFDDDRTMVSREAGEAAVTLSGAASDLLLFLWRRAPATPLEVLGDAALVERLFELAPPA